MTEAEVKERLGESKTSFVVNGSFWHRPEWSKEENEEYQRRLTHSGLVYEDLEVRFDQDGRVLRIDKLINGKPPAD